MPPASVLLSQLETSRKYFKTVLSVFSEEDSAFAPGPELFTVAAQVAHAADSVDWFVEGAFGKGWNLDFDAHLAAARAVASLAEAAEWFDRAYAAAAAAVESASPADLQAPIPDTRIMGGAPRSAVVNAIVDHTAHHRGSLAVYARLLHKEPPMPYA